MEQCLSVGDPVWGSGIPVVGFLHRHSQLMKHACAIYSYYHSDPHTILTKQEATAQPWGGLHFLFYFISLFSTPSMVEKRGMWFFLIEFY